MKKRQRLEVGFFDTPDKFAAAVASLDASIQKLKAAAATTNTGGINAAWRTEFSAFVHRWELERDQYGPWTSRLFLTVPNARLQTFKEAYQWWVKDFERKSGRVVASKPAVEAENLSASLVPGGTVMLGAALLLFVFLRGNK